MKTHQFALMILVAAMPTSLGAVQKQSAGKRFAPEQSHFGSEEEIDRPTAVPEEIVQTIRQIRKEPYEIQPEWLQASEIHLDGPNEIDLIVVGTGGLRGAHIVPFWVFRKKQTGYELVLATGGDALSVLKTRWKGFRDINGYGIGLAGAEITTVTYRFDGQRYQEFKTKTEQNNP
jgi:hypothetical protein